MKTFDEAIRTIYCDPIRPDPKRVIETAEKFSDLFVEAKNHPLMPILISNVLEVTGGNPFLALEIIFMCGLQTGLTMNSQEEL